MGTARFVSRRNTLTFLHSPDLSSVPRVGTLTTVDGSSSVVNILVTVAFDFGTNVERANGFFHAFQTFHQLEAEETVTRQHKGRRTEVLMCELMKSSRCPLPGDPFAT